MRPTAHCTSLVALRRVAGLALLSATVMRLGPGCASTPREPAAVPESSPSAAAEADGVTTAPPVDDGSWPADPSVAPPDVGAPPSDAIVTPTGLAYRVLRRGAGRVHPAPTSEVTLHYTAWTTDGAQFDSSVRRGVPITIRLNTVIAGWTEAITSMVEGERTRFWVPEALAYQGERAPYGMLVFDIELLSISP